MQSQKEAQPIHRGWEAATKTTEEAQASGALDKDFNSHKYAQRSKSQVWWLTLPNPALGRQKQDCHKFQAKLFYTTRYRSTQTV